MAARLLWPPICVALWLLALCVWWQPCGRAPACVVGEQTIGCGPQSEDRALSARSLRGDWPQCRTDDQPQVFQARPLIGKNRRNCRDSVNSGPPSTSLSGQQQCQLSTIAEAAAAAQTSKAHSSKHSKTFYNTSTGILDTPHCTDWTYRVVSYSFLRRSPHQKRSNSVARLSNLPNNLLVGC